MKAFIKNLIFRICTGLDLRYFKLDKITLSPNFDEILRKTLTKYKETKKLTFKELFYALITCFIAPFMIYFYNDLFQGNEIFFIVFAPLGLFIIWFHLGRIMLFWDDYMYFYKENFIYSIIKEIDKNFFYQHKKIEDFDIGFSEAGIVRYDYYTHREDFIQGKYLGISFELAEFHNHDSKINGIIFSCKFYKNFEFDLKVINKKIQKFKKIDNLDKLDNTKFNEIFSVIGENLTETRYLLSHSFMERLIKINQSKKFGFVSCAFKDDKFHLFMENSKDLFEPYLFFAPNLDLAKYYKAEILEILSVIDELNLTLNIYPKTVLKNLKK